jgi:hypothetical protein
MRLRALFRCFCCRGSAAARQRSRAAGRAARWEARLFQGSRRALGAAAPLALLVHVLRLARPGCAAGPGVRGDLHACDCFPRARAPWGRACAPPRAAARRRSQRLSAFVRCPPKASSSFPYVSLFAAADGWTCWAGFAPSDSLGPGLVRAPAGAPQPGPLTPMVGRSTREQTAGLSAAARLEAVAWRGRRLPRPARTRPVPVARAGRRCVACPCVLSAPVPAASFAPPRASGRFIWRTGGRPVGPSACIPGREFQGTGAAHTQSNLTEIDRCISAPPPTPLSADPGRAPALHCPGHSRLSSSIPALPRPCSPPALPMQRRERGVTASATMLRKRMAVPGAARPTSSARELQR